MIALLKQVLVTVLVVLIGLGGLVWVKPEIGRTIIAADLPFGATIRAAIVAIAPEAGGPAPEVAHAPGAGAFDPDAKTLAIASPVTNELSRTEFKALASAEATRAVTVYPDDTSGIVEDVFISSGDRVEAGQPLVRLERSLETVAVERAQLLLQAARDKLSRYRQLRERNAASSVELSDIEREVEAAALDLRDAQIALGKKEIRAPIAGRVGIVTIETGARVDSTSAIATIDDREELKLVFYTPERYLSDFEVGTALQAIPVARPDLVVDGRISAIDSRVAEDSRTARTEGLIANSDDTLRPGMAFSVSVALDGSTYLATDPLAVVWERTGPFVWAVRNERAEKTPVRIVEREPDRVLLSSQELVAGDLVVVEGVQSMREGLDLDVEIRDDAAIAEGEKDIAPLASVRTGESEPAKAEFEAMRNTIEVPRASDRSGS